MFQKFVMKAIPKLVANPALAVEMAPVLIVAGAALAVYDLVKE